MTKTLEEGKDTMKASRLVATTITLIFLFMVPNTPAHAQFTSGLTGTVSDQTGAAISGAKIVVTNQDTHVTRYTTTADNGDFRITSLPGRFIQLRSSRPDSRHGCRRICNWNSTR